MAKRRQQTGCIGRLVSMAAALLLLVSVAIVALVILFFVAPERVPQLAILQDPPALPTLALPVALAPEEELPTLVAAIEIPSATPSPGSAGLAPTWTPPALLPTVTPLPFSTLKPSVTPSPLPIFPTKTATPTPTPTNTNTPTATPLGPTPTPSPTRSAFPFTKTDNSPFYLQNHANNAGCGWLGLAGEVLDLTLNPVPIDSYRVHVWGGGIDERIIVGSAPDWEQFVFDSPVMRDYNVQLESPNGTAVSQIYRVQTRPNCNENLLQINFIQNH